MKISANKTELLRLLDTASSVITDNKIRPVISCVLFEAQEGILKATGTDLDVTVNVVSKVCEIIESGSCAIQPALITAYLKSIDNAVVVFTASEGRASISIDDEVTAEFEIADWEEYPQMKNISEGEKVELNRADFMRNIKRVRFAAFQDSSNFALNVIEMSQRQKLLTFAATNSFMMCVSELEVKEPSEYKINIPLKTTDAMLKMLEKSNDETVILQYCGNRIYIEFDSVKLTARLCDLPFAQVTAILQDAKLGKTVKIQCVSDELLKKCKTAILFASNSISGKNGAICEFIGQKLNIKAVGGGKCNEKVDTIKDGADLKISLNIAFLADYLKNTDERVLTIHARDRKTSVYCHTDSESYKLIMMPLAIAE